METLPALNRNEVDSLLVYLVEKNVPIEDLKEVLNERRKLRAELAELEFNKALCEFQKRCPVIKKEKEVRNKQGVLRYKYAPVEAIWLQVRDLLHECGFSITTDSSLNLIEGTATACCYLLHITGHSRLTRYTLPFIEAGGGGTMSKTQEAEGTLTIVQRKVFCNSLGILTSDDDYNGEAVEERVTDNQLWQIRELLLQKDVFETTVFAAYDVADLADLTSVQASEIIHKLEMFKGGV